MINKMVEVGVDVVFVVIFCFYKNGMIFEVLEKYFIKVY